VHLRSESGSRVTASIEQNDSLARAKQVSIAPLFSCDGQKVVDVFGRRITAGECHDASDDPVRPTCRASRHKFECQRSELQKKAFS